MGNVLTILICAWLGCMPGYAVSFAPLNHHVVLSNQKTIIDGVNSNRVNNFVIARNGNAADMWEEQNGKMVGDDVMLDVHSLSWHKVKTGKDTHIELVDGHKVYIDHYEDIGYSALCQIRTKQHVYEISTISESKTLPKLYKDVIETLKEK